MTTHKCIVLKFVLLPRSNIGEPEGSLRSHLTRRERQDTLVRPALVDTNCNQR
jgi:hypothetical protein